MFARAPRLSRYNPVMTEKIILDCDPGHDDAIAMMLALASSELEVLGVTVVYGNVSLERTLRNACVVREVVGRAIQRAHATPLGPQETESTRSHRSIVCFIGPRDRARWRAAGQMAALANRFDTIGRLTFAACQCG